MKAADRDDVTTKYAMKRYVKVAGKGDLEPGTGKTADTNGTLVNLFKVQLENNSEAKAGSLAGAFVKRPYPALLEVLEAEAEVGLKPARKPEWLRAKAPAGPNYHRLKALVKQHALHTVCEEAHCPNIGECWGAGTLTL